MPGKINPTQCEALAMVSTQAMANDVAVAFGGAGGHLQMNAYKPLIIFNVMNSVRTLSDGMNSFRQHLVDGMKPNKEQIAAYVARSLMLVTALSPAIGYDKAAEVAHYALDHDMTLKDAALKLEYITAEEFDHIVDPAKMV
jgi:fumarate hydratase class II